MEATHSSRVQLGSPKRQQRLSAFIEVLRMTETLVEFD